MYGLFQQIQKAAQQAALLVLFGGGGGLFLLFLAGIPLAGATLPVIAAFLFGIYGKNILLIIASAILGIGHIGIHLNHKREAE